MCTTLDPDLGLTEHEQAPGVAWGKAGNHAGKYPGVAWGQLGEQPQEAEETEEPASR